MKLKKAEEIKDRYFNQFKQIDENRKIYYEHISLLNEEDFEKYVYVLHNFDKFKQPAAYFKFKRSDKYAKLYGLELKPQVISNSKKEELIKLHEQLLKQYELPTKCFVRMMKYIFSGYQVDNEYSCMSITELKKPTNLYTN